jgi:hypothetical protein
MGGNAFCIKACDPAGKNAASLCQHIYDRIGCAYNAPNSAQKGTFESCQGEDQDPPGVYTSNGQVMTYTQPPESLGAINSIPYTARIPASSNCVTYESAELFAAMGSASSGMSGASVTPAPTGRVGASVGAGTKTAGATSTASSGSFRVGGSSSLVSLVGLALVVVLA